MLTPDLTATEKIDIIRNSLEYGLYIQKAIKAGSKDSVDKEQAEALIKELQEALDGYKAEPDSPVVEIGFIPAAKKTALEYASSTFYKTLDKGDAKFLSPAQYEQQGDIAREWIRYGVKGHSSISLPFESEPLTFKGREIKVASWNMVDLYEHMGLLFSLQYAIKRFNSLDTKKKSS